MPVDFRELLKDPAFAAISPEAGESLVALIGRISGKSAMEAMPHVMEFMKTSKGGAPIPKNERAAMIAAMMAALPEEDRKRFSQIVMMLNMTA